MCIRDRLNRFYVAREHADLTASFDSPPNCFDQFALPVQRELEAARVEQGRLLQEVRLRDELVQKQADEIDRHRALLEAATAERATRVSKSYLKRCGETLRRRLNKR